MSSNSLALIQERLQVMELSNPEAGWTVAQWRNAQLGGALSQEKFCGWLAQFSTRDPAWIFVASEETVRRRLSELEALRASGVVTRESHPLFGVPFAVKDNIDVKGMPTTAACPAFRFFPERDATVVALLLEAGAVVIGKTNLDQFATGLVGTRSPYGTVPSAFNPEYIGGGSSSGSAALVARGALPFALGTDTAGSGRVPAAFGNIVGLKPTRGRLSTRGVVPACRTLDCVSVFALTVFDAQLVTETAEGFDELDPYSRHVLGPASRSGDSVVRIGVPSELEFCGDALAAEAHARTIEYAQALGWQIKPFDFSPFQKLAKLLYSSPWVAERSLAARRILKAGQEEMDATVYAIVEPARHFSAEDAFLAEYERAELARRIELILKDFDAVLVPTTPTTYKISEVEASPFETNARLGTYTNFTNLADLSAIAIPGCFRSDGLPTGVTLLAPAFHDSQLTLLGKALHATLDPQLGATKVRLSELRALVSDEAASLPNALAASEPQLMEVAVLGAHLSGMPLNHQLIDLGAVLLQQTCTAPSYELYLLAGSSPKKPGLKRVSNGAKVELEVWALPKSKFADFISQVNAPLGIGSIELQDGRWVKGFICEPWGLEGAEEITRFGGFRAYVEQVRLMRGS